MKGVSRKKTVEEKRREEDVGGWKNEKKSRREHIKRSLDTVIKTKKRE